MDHRLLLSIAGLLVARAEGMRKHLADTEMAPDPHHRAAIAAAAEILSAIGGSIRTAVEIRDPDLAQSFTAYGSDGGKPQP